MESSLESESSVKNASNGRNWAKMGAVALTSALAGGIAVAWFYRRTLTRLQEADGELGDSVSRSLVDAEDEDI